VPGFQKWGRAHFFRYDFQMVKMKKKIEKNYKLPVYFVSGVALITIFFNSRIQDPFNAPKMWLLIFLGAWLTGQVVINKKFIFINSQRKITFYLSLIFIFFLLIASIFTDVKITAFFGENQRRTGFLTYLGYVLTLIGALILIKLDNLKSLAKIAAGTGLLLAFYGTLQITGNDFISWNNPYNAIISTVGNPNFAAAIMAILGVISFGLALYSSASKFIRVFAGLTSMYLLVIIYLSDALQGLLSFVVGITTILIVVIFQRNKNLGVISIATSGILGVTGILGMLQIGPLSDYLYKSSVTVRGYYWRAGLEMFKNHPVFGVGVDRYGAYFKEFRDKQYPLNYGFDITSTNAHNVPIQLFATAGVFVGIIYLFLMVYIFIRGIQGIRKFQGSNQILFAAIFGAWLAYQAQSIVSIDNIGIAVWGWLLGGVVLGVSSQENMKEVLVRPIEKESQYIGSLVSGVLLICALVLNISLYRGEYNMFQQRARFNPQIAENRIPFNEFATKTLDSPLLEPYYKMTTGAYLVSNMYVDEGMKVLREVYEADHRNLDNLGLLATFSMQLSKFDDAIKYRKEIVELDPWDGKNYLELGRLYKSVGKLSEMNLVREKIISFAPDTPEAATAKSELIA